MPPYYYGNLLKWEWYKLIFYNTFKSTKGVMKLANNSSEIFVFESAKATRTHSYTHTGTGPESQNQNGLKFRVYIKTVVVIIIMQNSCTIMWHMSMICLLL